jgi:hypothetical protein
MLAAHPRAHLKVISQLRQAKSALTLKQVRICCSAIRHRTPRALCINAGQDRQVPQLQIAPSEIVHTLDEALAKLGVTASNFRSPATGR